MEPIEGSTLGAVVRGCSLANEDLEDDPQAWRLVYDAFLEHALLIRRPKTLRNRQSLGLILIVSSGRQL